MKISPFLTGAALLFWGLQTRHLIFAVILALVLEGARFIRLRWVFSPADFNRVWDFCGVLFIGFGLYVYVTDPFGTAALVFVQWWPVLFFPFMAVHAHDSSDKIPLTTVFWILRKRAGKETGQMDIRPYIPHIYFAICIMAASAANVQDMRFYIGLCMLCSWALWFERSKSTSVFPWVCLLIITVGLGYAGHVGLSALQEVVVRKTMQWFSGEERNSDFYESRTAIGYIGNLKASGRIVIRVKVDERENVPALLREASYNAFQTVFYDSRWYAQGIKMDVNVRQSDGTVTAWKLLSPKDPHSEIQISTGLRSGKGLLPLPMGTFQLEDLPVLLLEQSRLGAVEVSGGPGMIHFRAKYGPGQSIDSPPNEHDLKIPDKEQPGLTKIITDLGLSSKKKPREILDTVADFFRDKFEYSQYLSGPVPTTANDPWLADAPVSHFLARGRSGHCEYFATATVLRMRPTNDILDRVSLGWDQAAA